MASKSPALSALLRGLWPPVAGEDDIEIAPASVERVLGITSHRTAHVLAVAKAARNAAAQLRLEGAVAGNVETAALMHDIGYAEVLVRTGFHPLDGAAFLARRGVSDQVVEAVLHHSGAAEEARHHPGATTFYAACPRPTPPSLVTDLVTFCDLRTGSRGQQVTIGERVADVGARYGAGHAVSRAMTRNVADFRRCAARVRREIADAASSRLPWVFCDVDGTLVEPGGQLSDETIRVIRGFISAGGRFSLATGKHPAAISHLCRAMRSPGPHIALNGGALVYDSGAKLMASLGPAAHPVAARLRAEGVATVQYALEGTCSESLLTQDQLLALSSISEPLPTGGSGAETGRAAKLLCFVDVDDARIEARLRQIGEEHGLSVVRTSSRFVEFLPKGLDKGVAAVSIMRDAGWPCIHSVAIGDGENDLPMMRVAGLAVGAQTATPEVREAADAISSASYGKGVAALLRQFLQGEGM